MTTKAPPYTLTNDSITVVWGGKNHVVKKGTPHFTNLKTALMEERWDDVPQHLTIEKSIKEWAKGKFKLQGDSYTYEGVELPSNINHRIVEMAAAGANPTPLFNFWERLQKNPSKRSVDQLFEFLKHEGIPLTEDGCFLAYKSVRHDYKDVHSGEFSNKPGVTNEMPRNQISDDPREACHEGFHVGALAYAKSFHSGGHLVVCKVDPADVVCVPYDSSQQKMRVCKYKVIGNHNDELLPSTVVLDADLDVDIPEASDDDVVEVSTAKPGATTRTAKPKQKKASFASMDKMDMKGLMDQSIEDLRQYAGKSLEIVGASKIPGGKTALVKKILAVRR